MSEERDRRLVELFETSAVELDGEEFAARVRRRIARVAMVARVRRAVLVLALAGIGVFYFSKLDSAFVAAQASIDRALASYVLKYSLGTLTTEQVVVASLLIGFVIGRRLRRRI